MFWGRRGIILHLEYQRVCPFVGMGFSGCLIVKQQPDVPCECNRGITVKCIEYHIFCPCVGLDPPHRQECCPPFGSKGGNTLAGGGSKFGRLERKPGTIYSVDYIVVHWVPQFLTLRRNWVPPPPLAARVLLPPLGPMVACGLGGRGTPFLTIGQTLW